MMKFAICQSCTVIISCPMYTLHLLFKRVDKRKTIKTIAWLKLLFFLKTLASATVILTFAFFSPLLIYHESSKQCQLTTTCGNDKTLLNCHVAVTLPVRLLQLFNKTHLSEQMERVDCRVRHTLPIDKRLRDQKNKPNTANRHAVKVSQGNITKW